MITWNWTALYVPDILKCGMTIPLPKRLPVSSLDRPATCIVMKILEQFVLPHLRYQLPPSLDPFQFAYVKKRCNEDAVTIALHNVLEFLDKKTPNYRAYAIH